MSNDTQTDMQGGENAVLVALPTAATSILLGDPSHSGTNLLGSNSAIVPSFDMATFLRAFQSMQTKRGKSVHLRDPRTFGGQPRESAEEFMLRYERCAIVPSWNDDDNLTHMNLACEKSALRWHDGNKTHFVTFADLKKEFLKAFGKWSFRSLRGVSLQMIPFGVCL